MKLEQDLKLRRKKLPGVFQEFFHFFDLPGVFYRSAVHFQEFPGVSRSADHPAKLVTKLMNLLHLVVQGATKITLPR